MLFMAKANSILTFLITSTAFLFLKYARNVQRVPILSHSGLDPESPAFNYDVEIPDQVRDDTEKFSTLIKTHRRSDATP